MKDFGLVVLGAHSGKHLKDLLNEYVNSKILLVEPVPYNYEALEKNYGKKENFYICKYAILNEKKTDNFYYVKKDSIHKLGKHWASGIGSFNKKHLLNHKRKRFLITSEDIQKIEIDFITFEDLVKKFEIRSIDKLQIDVEGAEFKIMNSINYTDIKINQILFESKHYDGTFKEGKKLEEIKKKLLYYGYKLKKIDKENILAYK